MINVPGESPTSNKYLQKDSPGIPINTGYSSRFGLLEPVRLIYCSVLGDQFLTRETAYMKAEA